jgi:hypothetical protein
MVFAVNTDGTDFTNLYSFTGLSDGRSPAAGLILSGNTLYGTTSYPEINAAPGNPGTVFSISFRPKLTIVPSTTNLLLAWPTNYLSFDYSGYNLQSTIVLPKNWTGGLDGD